MIIVLVPVMVPPGGGAYGKAGILPPRMRWLHPEAADAFSRIATVVCVSDMYRSAESSLAAMQAKRGVLPPGFSRHGYGLAVDLDVGETMKRLGTKSKPQLDGWMLERGWTCHRLDGKLEIESWHFNYRDARDTIFTGERTTRAMGERQLQRLYGSQMKLSPREVQEALAKLGLYRGAINGKIGPLSIAAGEAFARAWKIGGGMKADAPKPSASFQRVLAFVAADLRWPDGTAINVRVNP
jgi:hypothetical protein